MTCCCFETTFPKVSSFSCKKKNVLLVNPWQGMTSKQEKRHWLIGTAIIRFLLVKHTPKKSASTFIFIYIRLQLLIFCCGFLRHPGEISLGKQGDNKFHKFLLSLLWSQASCRATCRVAQASAVKFIQFNSVQLLPSATTQMQDAIIFCLLFHFSKNISFYV